MKRVYWVGRGRCSWRDRANWSCRSGGPGGALPSPSSEIVLDEGSGDGVVNLRWTPYARLEISGFAGVVITGRGRLDFRPSRRRRWWRREPIPTFAPRWLGARVRTQGGWQQAVRARACIAYLSVAALTVIPLVLGGVTNYFWVGGSGNTNDSAHYSLTSGGVGGAGTPIAGDTVTIDGNSGVGAFTVTVNAAFAAAAVTINNANTTWLDNSGTTLSGAMTVTTGALNTNGQPQTWGSFSSQNSNVRTLTFGASAILVTGGGAAWSAGTVTNMTVTANSAVVTLSGASATFQHNLSLNGASVVMTGSGTAVVSAAPTVVNFTRTGTAAKTDSLQMNGGFTATGTVTLNSNSATNRLLVFSNTPGTSRTITAAALVCSGAIDFMDVVGSGAAVWTTAASGATFFGDCGGNTLITFTPSSPQAATASASWSWSDATKWTSRVPLPQDDVTVSITAGTPTVTLDMPRLGRTLDFSGTTVAAVLAFGSTTTSLFGSVAVPAAMGAPTGTNALTLAGRAAYSVSIAKTLLCPLVLTAPGGTYTASGNITALSFSVTSTSSLSMGSGTWTATRNGGTPWSVAATASITAGTSTITFTGTGGTFAGGGKTYSTFKVSPIGTAGITITGSNTFATLDLECSTARVVTLPASGTQSITGAIILKGASGQLLSVVSSAPGTRTILSLAPGATRTEAFDNPSADVIFTSPIAASVAGPVEATAAKRMPRTITVPTDEVPNGLLSPTQGCVVAAVQPNFNSSDPITLDCLVHSLDDLVGPVGVVLQSNNKIQMGWSVVVPHEWVVLRRANGNSDPALRVNDVFAAGDNRVIAGAYDATEIYFSLAGAPFVSSLSPGVPTGMTHLRIANGPSGIGGDSSFKGTILWVAYFSAKISDADIAALNAAYLNAYPSFSALPAGATALYRNDWGYYVTAEGTTGRLAAESPQGLAATAVAPSEALLGLLDARTVPLETVHGGVSQMSADPAESLAGVAQAGQEPLEALRAGVAQTATDPVESLTGIAPEQRTLPFASNGPPGPGRAAGRVSRSGGVDGEVARTGAAVGGEA